MTITPAYGQDYKPGTRVRMTGKFLRNTGQIIGGEGQSRWIVQDCMCGLCRSGRFIQTDEPSILLDPTPNEPAFRHINVNNLERC